MIVVSTARARVFRIWLSIRTLWRTPPVFEIVSRLFSIIVIEDSLPWDETAQWGQRRKKNRNPAAAGADSGEEGNSLKVDGKYTQRVLNKALTRVRPNIISRIRSIWGAAMALLLSLLHDPLWNAVISVGNNPHPHSTLFMWRASNHLMLPYKFYCVNINHLLLRTSTRWCSTTTRENKGASDDQQQG